MMRKVFSILLSTLLMSVSMASQAQVLSFENLGDLSSWKTNNADVAVSGMRYKFGTSSLQISWKPGAIVTLEYAPGLMEASRSKNGGITAWFYDEGSQPADMQIVFLSSDNKEVCRIPYRLGFKGWRCIWAKFIQDMGKKYRDTIAKMQLHFPQTSGNLYIDMLEFQETVHWKYMEDAHYSISRTNFSMIPDIMKYREAVPKDDLIDATDAQIDMISERVKGWILGTGQFTKDKYVKMRTGAEKVFIANGLAEAAKIEIEYNDDGTPVGEPLFTLDVPNVVEGKKLMQFTRCNEKVLIPLALDYHKNGNEASVEKAKYIFDWFNDQGWADGSSMGTIVLEKLRSAGYIYSFFLLQDKFTPEKLQRERAAMNWFTMFGHCYELEPRGGTNSDDLRALGNGKLFYALSIEDPKEKRLALTAFKRYMDKAVDIAPGGEDVIKDDFSGYHHRTAYNSGYYPQAIYASAQIAWMLRDTPYALSKESIDNIKKALKTFHFLCAGLEVPAGTVGRFPKAQKVLHEILPACAYMILCENGSDKELLEIYSDIYAKAVKDSDWIKYVTGVNSDMSYMTTVGEMEAVAQALSLINFKTPKMKQGSLFMPYSGLHISKDEEVHFNVKGYSRYIWDYEAGTNGLNKYGRWISNGHLEFFDFRNGNKSFHPADELYDWNHIAGTTVKVLPSKALAYNNVSTDHRNYSDQSFLAGVHGADKVSMFSVRLHDIYADTSFRADKSYFFFKDMVLCLGSGVNCLSRENPVVTTIFQDLKGAGKQISDNVYEDASFAYVVKEGKVRFSKEGKQSKAYVEHGLAPSDGGYEYYMIKDKGSAASVKAASPVNVLCKDASAHIVERDGDICAAIFKSGVVFEGMAVESVNIPLAYILENKGNGEYCLNLCEPDMRRSWALNMNNLNDQQVAEESQPFDTVLTLNGDWDLVGDAGAFTIEKTDGKTMLKLTTAHGRNYTVKLKINK